MRIARFSWKNREIHGVLEEDQVFTLEGDFPNGLIKGDYLCDLDQIDLLAPARPSKVVGVGQNYRGPLEEPLLFLKTAETVIGPQEHIELPPASSEVRLSAELAVVVGRRLENASTDEAWNAILGYTCANDVYARDIYRREDHRPRGKTYRTFCPLGPVIETELDPSNLLIRSRLNGKLMDEFSSSEMSFDVGELLHHFSKVVTFHPWDVLITGAGGSTTMCDGDVAEIEIEGIGILRNPVRAANG